MLDHLLELLLMSEPLYKGGMGLLVDMKSFIIIVLLELLSLKFMFVDNKWS